MKTNSIDAALDFLPEETGTGPSKTPSGLLATLAMWVKAMGAGLQAANRYKQLTSRGMSSPKAAEKAFEENLA